MGNRKNLLNSDFNIFKDHELNQSEVADRNTNNAAEIQAVTETIKLAKIHGLKKILVHTDSNFLIDCVTKVTRYFRVEL